MKLSAIDFSKLAVMLLPTFLRTTSSVELVRVLSVPFIYLQDLFFKNREKNLYRLSHNGQVCYLRSALNDAFLYREKDFEIVDAEDTGVWQYAYDESFFLEQLILDDAHPTILYSEDMMTKFADFKVKIPSNLSSVDNMNVIKSLVNTYKLISKKAIYEYY